MSHGKVSIQIVGDKLQLTMASDDAVVLALLSPEEVTALISGLLVNSVRVYAQAAPPTQDACEYRQL